MVIDTPLTAFVKPNPPLPSRTKVYAAMSRIRSVFVLVVAQIILASRVRGTEVSRLQLHTCFFVLLLVLRAYFLFQ